MNLIYCISNSSSYAGNLSCPQQNLINFNFSVDFNEFKTFQKLIINYEFSFKFPE